MVVCPPFLVRCSIDPRGAFRYLRRFVLRTPLSMTQATWLGHPRGLATCFFTEMWERFTFYGMRSLLVLFMTAAVMDGGLGMTERDATAVYGLYLGCVYLFSLPGGWVADRLTGQRNAVIYGALI